MDPADDVTPLIEQIWSDIRRLQQPWSEDLALLEGLPEAIAAGRVKIDPELLEGAYEQLLRYDHGWRPPGRQKKLEELSETLRKIQEASNAKAG